MEEKFLLDANIIDRRNASIVTKYSEVLRFYRIVRCIQTKH